jgi:hypothetical protein
MIKKLLACPYRRNAARSGPRQGVRRIFSGDQVVQLCTPMNDIRRLFPGGWVRGSSIRHQSDCGMHPQWQRLGSRIEYRTG